MKEKLLGKTPKELSEVAKSVGLPALSESNLLIGCILLKFVLLML